MRCSLDSKRYVRSEYDQSEKQKSQDESQDIKQINSTVSLRDSSSLTELSHLTSSSLAELYASPAYTSTVILSIKRAFHSLLAPIKSSSLTLHHITVGLAIWEINHRNRLQLICHSISPSHPSGLQKSSI